MIESKTSKNKTNLTKTNKIKNRTDMQYKNLIFIGIVSTFLGWGAVATAAEPTLAESLPGIEARINFENKQVVRQQNSNQYMQLLSVTLNKTDPKHLYREYTFRVTTNSSKVELDAFLKVASAKMFEIDCKSHNFEHSEVGNRYIYITKNKDELFRFEDSEAICATIED